MRLGSALAWVAGALALLTAHCGSTDDKGLYAESGGSAGEGGGAGNAGTSAGVLGVGGVSPGGTGGSTGQDASGPDTGGMGGNAASGGGGGSGGGNCSQYCADADGDGHGDPTKRPTACNNLGSEWVTICDDCQDRNADVFPGATTCKAAPYVVADGITQSFDYDCSGSATECGEVIKATGSCMPSGAACTGAGYVPDPERAEAGVEANPYCGSTRYRLCNRTTLISCSMTTETREAIPCL